MEEVLETYEKPYDPNHPVVCMDEQPVQLIKESRQPIAATKNHPKRVDYEYERVGTASIFMFNEPLAGWRQATAHDQRTKPDWAQELRVHAETWQLAKCRRERAQFIDSPVLEKQTGPVFEKTQQGNKGVVQRRQ